MGTIIYLHVAPSTHCHTGLQYSAVACTRVRVTVCWVVAPAPQPQPASHLRSTTCDVNFLQSDSRCQRYMSDLSNVTPRYLGSEAEDRVSLLKLTFSSRVASLLLRWKAANAVFVVLSFRFQVWWYSPTVAMSLLSTHSTACQSPSASIIVWSSAYVYFLETVVGKSEMLMLKRRDARTDPCGSHSWGVVTRDVNTAAFRAVRFWKILPRTSRAVWLSNVLSSASAAFCVDVHLMMNICKTKRHFGSYCLR